MDTQSTIPFLTFLNIHNSPRLSSLRKYTQCLSINHHPQSFKCWRDESACICKYIYACIDQATLEYIYILYIYILGMGQFCLLTMIFCLTIIDIDIGQFLLTAIIVRGNNRDNRYLSYQFFLLLQTFKKGLTCF